MRFRSFRMIGNSISSQATFKSEGLFESWRTVSVPKPHLPGTQFTKHILVYVGCNQLQALWIVIQLYGKIVQTLTTTKFSVKLCFNHSESPKQRKLESLTAWSLTQSKARNDRIMFHDWLFWCRPAFSNNRLVKVTRPLEALGLRVRPQGKIPRLIN